MCAVSTYYLQCSDAVMKNLVFCKSWDQIKTEEQYSKNKKLWIKKSVISTYINKHLELTIIKSMKHIRLKLRII